MLRRRLSAPLRLGARQARGLSVTNAAITRPRMEEIVLVRHGESEGNVAFNRSVAGDHSLYSGAFLERHSSFWRLTDRGRAQALTAGEWLRDNCDLNYDGFYTSEYLRAMETAALLDMQQGRWRPEVMLRERDWGEYDLLDQLQRKNAYRQYEKRRRRESLFWAPPGGESLAQVVQRVDSVLLFTNRRYSGGRVILACHGELMWAFRLRFERLTQCAHACPAVDACGMGRGRHFARQWLLSPSLPPLPGHPPMEGVAPLALRPQTARSRREGQYGTACVTA